MAEKKVKVKMVRRLRGEVDGRQVPEVGAEFVVPLESAKALVARGYAEPVSKTKPETADTRETRTTQAAETRSESKPEN